MGGHGGGMTPNIVRKVLPSYTITVRAEKKQNPYAAQLPEVAMALGYMSQESRSRDFMIATSTISVLQVQRLR